MKLLYAALLLAVLLQRGHAECGEDGCPAEVTNELQPDMADHVKGLAYGDFGENGGVLFATTPAAFTVVTLDPTSGEAVLFAGQEGEDNHDNGHALIAAGFRNPFALAVDAGAEFSHLSTADSPTLFVSDIYSIRAISFDPETFVGDQVTTLAGSNDATEGGAADGTGTNAQFNKPYGLAFAYDVVYVSDTCVITAPLAAAAATATTVTFRSSYFLLVTNPPLASQIQQQDPSNHHGRCDDDSRRRHGRLPERGRH